MRVLFIYFTGTYNTRYVTDLLDQKWQENHHETKRIEICSDTPSSDTSSFDLIGIGYPIYGFNSPKILNDYLKKVRFRENQPYFIYKNSGETFAANNASSRIIIRRLKRKKLKLIGEYHFVMPYNIHFAFERAFIKEIIEMNHKLTEVLYAQLMHHQGQVIKTNLFYRFFSVLVSVQKIGGPINSFFYKVDVQKCIHCLRCVRECPTKNIALKNGKIVFSHRCLMCMRCSFYCPVNAIHIGMLQRWRVNQAYNLQEIEQDKTLKGDYIHDDSKGFYRCFIRTFKKIDEDYEKIQKPDDL